MDLYDQESAGLFGVVTTTGTGAVAGNFALIHCLTATTFTTFTETNGSGAMTDFAVPAGTIIRGRITNYECSGGNTVRAHRAGSPQGS